MLLIEKRYGDPHSEPWADHPYEGGFPAHEEQLLVCELKNHHYIHGFMCKRAREKIKAGETVDLHKTTLLSLEVLLNAWSTNRAALAPCPYEWWEPCFGVRPGRKGFLKERDRLRKEAKGLAKKIRKARRYVKKMKKKHKGTINAPKYYVVYTADYY